MFEDFEPIDDRPVYIQLKDYVKRIIIKGALQPHQKLPSTREMGEMVKFSRNTVIAAYAALEEDGFAYVIPGQGSYVAAVSGGATTNARKINWGEHLSDHARLAEQLDLMKHGITGQRGTISFTSIAPDEKLFDTANLKRAFLDKMSIEGNVLLNYGYAKGYKPLMNYLLEYMQHKGVDVAGKDLLVTSGFTEGLDIVLSALGKKNGKALCENPTHQTALKNFKLHGYEMTGIPMEDDGISILELEKALSSQQYDCAYFVPSYHNPTGIVMSSEKRQQLMTLMNQYEIPVIEDGFNEELRYSGAHVSPLMTVAGSGNNVIYLGSFSKVLFPGIRVGWVLADKELISYLESIKRARTIHTSTLDQGVLYQYLHNGHLEKYLKKARTEYKRKYELTMQCCEKYIPYAKLSGHGGLHLFVTFQEGFATRRLLELCQAKGVIFTPGDIFFTDGGGGNTLRLGFSRVADEDIIKGIRIIGETASQLLG